MGGKTNESMIGTYRFYQDGELIGESHNLLTTRGKRSILAYLAQRGVSIGRAMSFGTGSTAPAVDDVSLEFEFARSLITSISPDYINNRIIFKTALIPSLSGKIYEVGLFSQMDSGIVYGSRLLISFDQASEQWTGGTWESTNQRIGIDGLHISTPSGTPASSKLNNIFLDLGGYSLADSLLLAGYVNDSNTDTVKVQFMNSDTDYYEFTIGGWTAGYNVKSFSKSAATVVGNPDWTAITAINIIVTPDTGVGTTIDFDGMRVEDRDYINPDYYLISRSVLSSPIEKKSDSPLEVEYTVEVNFS